MQFLFGSGMVPLVRISDIYYRAPKRKLDSKVQAGDCSEGLCEHIHSRPPGKCITAFEALDCPLFHFRALNSIQGFFGLSAGGFSTRELLAIEAYLLGMSRRA